MDAKIKIVFVLLYAYCYVCFPTNMEGYWQGIPDVTPLGPWTSLFNFTILPLANSSNEWLLSDFYEEGQIMIPGTEQQWWIEDTVGMTYCGLVYNFFRVPAPVIRNFTETFQSSTQIQWCSNGCDKLQWTLTLLDDNTLLSHFLYADPANHLNVTLTRLPSLKSMVSIPMKPPCNITIEKQYDEEEIILEDEKFEMKSCPFKHLHNKPSSTENSLNKKTKNLPKKISDQYQYCYILNDAVEYAIAWNFLIQESKLQVAISVPLNNEFISSDNSYVGLGFAPYFPGMYNADVVLGYNTVSSSCVRSMYVPYYVGPPIDDSSMPLQDTSVSNNNGRLIVEFTRAFDSGHHNITITKNPREPGVYFFQIMWAVGDAPLTCSATPHYHGNNRGYRYIDWMNPSSIFPDFMKCSFDSN